jgi:hypothetical protein
MNEHCEKQLLQPQDEQSGNECVQKCLKIFVIALVGLLSFTSVYAFVH